MGRKNRSIASRSRRRAAAAILAASLAWGSRPSLAQAPEAAPAFAPPAGAPAAATPAPAPPNFDHAPFEAILKAHVNEKGLVNYETLLQDRAGLDAYIASVGAVAMPDLLGWPRDEQAAFYINAYNAIALKRIIDHWPPKKGGLFSGSKLSIQNISGALSREKDLVAGEEVTLDQIENDILRGRYSDPRTMFALSNSSLGGASLTQEAFVAAKLGKQLDDACSRFVRDTSKVMVDTGGNLTTISPLFKKRAEDFGAYVQEYPDVKSNPSIPEKYQGSIAFITKHSDSRLQDWVLRALYKLKVGDHDWTLNSQ